MKAKRKAFIQAGVQTQPSAYELCKRKPGRFSRLMNEQERRRELLPTTLRLNEFVSGAILFDEKIHEALKRPNDDIRGP
jgi:hypothetical protein